MYLFNINITWKQKLNCKITSNVFKKFCTLLQRRKKNVFLVWRFVVLEIFPVILHCPIWFTILTILIDFNKVWPYSFSLPNNVYNPNNDYNPFLIFLRMDLIRLPHTHPRLTSLSYCTFHWVGNKQHTYKVYYSVQCGKLKKKIVWRILNENTHIGLTQHFDTHI